MTFHPFDVNVAHLAYTFLGGFVVLFGMFSLLIKEKLYIGEAVISTVVGIAIGPYALDLFSPVKWGGGHDEVVNEITLEVTRVVIAIGVFAVGVELPKAYMKRKWKSLAFLLGPVMVWGWMVTAGLLMAIFPKIDFLGALAIAACVTPTDPILAQAVVGGKFADKHVPAHIRHLLSAESGCNDGAAFPFLYIAIYLILDASDAHAVGEWFYVTCYEVLLGTILGSVLGFSARKVMKFSERKGLIDRQSFVAQYVSLAVLSIGMTTLLGSDDLLAAFACGTAFAWDGFFNKATEDSMFSNVIDLLFNCAAFIYIGAIIPFHTFADAALSLAVWRLIVLAIGVLTLRRLPIVIALYKFIPDVKTFREALFVGWFGPMGVGAIFISTLARTKLPTPAYPPENAVDAMTSTIQPIVAFLVLTSVLCHGLSIPFFSLTRRVHSITHTWSRSSMDMRGDDPAWSTHAQRIQRGQKIRINRDDDPVGQDNTIVDDVKADSVSGVLDEKLVRDGSVGSSGSTSETPRNSDGASIPDAGGERADVEAMEDGTYEPDSGSSQTKTEKRAENLEDNDCRQIPVLAEYREGNHLVIERKIEDSDEVTVEVIRNHYSDQDESQTESWKHPHPLKRKEVDALIEKLQHSLTHAISAVKPTEEPLDRLGIGMMTGDVVEEEEAEERERLKDNEARERGLEEGKQARVERGFEGGTSVDLERTRSPEEVESQDEPESSASGRGAGLKFSSLKQKLFGGKKDSDESTTPKQAEEGRAPIPLIRVESRMSGTLPRSALLQPSHSRTPSVNAMTIPASAAASGSVSGSGVGASEGTTPPDNAYPPRSAVRFTEDTAPTPSGSKGYGHVSNNPNLAMYRSQSVQSTHSGRGIRFTEDTAPSSDTVPSGMRGYGHTPKNPSLTMERTKSVQSNSSAKEKRGLSFR